MPAGKTDSRPIIQLDVLPTALAAAGVAEKPEWNLDGVDLLPFLTGKRTDAPHDALFWRMGGIMAMRLLRRRPGLVAAGAFALMMATPLLPHSYVERLASITDESKDETGSREARRTAMREAWRDAANQSWTAARIRPRSSGGSPLRS